MQHTALPLLLVSLDAAAHGRPPPTTVGLLCCARAVCPLIPPPSAQALYNEHTVTAALQHVYETPKAISPQLISSCFLWSQPRGLRGGNEPTPDEEGQEG